MPLSRYKIARPLLAVSRHSPVRLTSASVAPHESHGEVGVVHRVVNVAGLPKTKGPIAGPYAFFVEYRYCFVEASAGLGASCAAAPSVLVASSLSH
jgi:hypothetical protein